MRDKSTSLHHTDNKNGLCVFLNFDGGRRWKLSATPILPGRDNPCPQISAGDSRVIYEGELEKAIDEAKAHGKKMMTLRVHGHDVQLIVKNVVDKMAHVREMERSYQPRKKRKK